MTPNSPSAVGIDLGTTNTAVAEAEPGQLPRTFDLLQLIRPGDAQVRPALPSFLYLAGDDELPAGSLDLPWATDRTFMVGEGARARGAEVPLRLVASAKSWLSHTGVDRKAEILPAQTPPEQPKVSPVEASARFLRHVREAWAHVNPDRRLEEANVYLTVPASFDAVARELTIAAATEAGLLHVTLLEEPQAAFYAWLAEAGDDWREVLGPEDRVLVCDVGGGTTDFSLIEVRDDGEGNLGLERVAVGDHLLLGGDNMDLALAHHLATVLRQSGKKLDASQNRALVAGVRRAKEALLSNDELDRTTFSILGSGRKLIGGQIKVELERAALEAVLLEGFFPPCDRDAARHEMPRTGFMELGLPFVSDAAITRHLAHFLATHAGGALPTHILFNGGVFNSPLLRARLLEVIASWGVMPKVLESASNDLAVSRGAAYYGMVRAEGGMRIRGGVARSYYIGIQSSMPAVPGVPPPIRALCVVPFGMEEGTEAVVPGGELGLVVGAPVQFRFLSSTTRPDDAIGTILDEYTWPDDLTETAPVSATLSAEGLEPGTLVPVRLEVKVTEVGTLELWSVATQSEHRWRLEYNVREEVT